MGGDSASDRLSFLVTWDDPLSGLTRCSVYQIFSTPEIVYLSSRQFYLTFNPEDSTVEMCDNRSRKTFLKKTVTTEV